MATSTPSSSVRSLIRLLRSPTFAGAAILTLALGIGAAVAIFSVAYNVMFKALPYQDPESVLAIWNEAPGLVPGDVPTPAALYFTYKDHAQSIDNIAVYERRTVSLSGRGKPEEVRAIYTTHELFPVLGESVLAGVWLSADDDLPGAAPVVLVSEALAQSRFASAEQAVGKPISISGTPTAILGVFRDGFRAVDRGGDIILPLRIDRSQTRMTQFNYLALARMSQGSSPELVATELTDLLSTSAEEFSSGMPLETLQEAGHRVIARPVLQEAVGSVRTVLWVLVGTVGLLLLIAFANVANLFLVRADGRRREIALRTALGASRLDLHRQFLGESLVLSLVSGGLGLLFAGAAIKLLHALAPSSLPRLQEIGINSTVVLFAFGLSLASGLLFGTLPALKSSLGAGWRSRSTGRLMGALKEGGRASTISRRSHLVRHGLVVTQIGLALVLLIGSGLMIRTFQSLLDVDPGFAYADRTLTFGVGTPSSMIESNEEVARFQAQLIDQFAALPGVESAAAVSHVPLQGWGSRDALWVEDDMPEEGTMAPIRTWKFVSDGFFETMGRPLIAGRTINKTDLEERRQVAVVTENLAAEYWASPQQALGRRVQSDPGHDAWWEIVGVVGNVYHDGIDQEATDTVYFPSVNLHLWGNPDELFVARNLNYILRAEPGIAPKTLLPSAERIVATINPDLPVTGPETMEEVYRDSFARTAFTLTIIGIAASVALLLGLIGVYATLSYIIQQRTQEFGVRIALGAQKAQVRSMVLRQGLLLAGLGVGLGVAGAFASTRVLSRMVYGVTATDATTFLAVSVLLITTVAAATLIAARRATRVSPLEALRGD